MKSVRALCAAAAIAISAGDIDPDVSAVLSRDLHFSAAELADLERGKIVKHSIDAQAAGEVAVAGAVRIGAPKSAFVGRVRDIERFKRGPEIMQIGRFSDPPVRADLDRLTVDKDDFDVRTCRVGHCDVRLPAAIIKRFQDEIDPKSPDVQRRTAELFKQVLLEEVIAYETGGPGRILSYDDGPKPIRPVEEFEGILGDEPALGALAPGLPRHLRFYPSGRLEGAEDFLYWSKEKFGPEPFITVTHVTIFCGSSRTCVVATRDVYSSRYVDASLAVTVATDSLADPTRFYLVYANRSRASAMKGGLSGLRRSIVGRRARGSLEDSLKQIKAQLEPKR
ncbi:MAG TPA: hypothetical protein VGY57_12090 [Vicinamibacterales bacterium]|jgi:hypothetical protein|nr:hypothetical protein [Vicinamibacterales bacterium]